ncbi:MAG: Gfo/Idh/MocA family oxidoreductase [Chthoniobacterales bacterium]
MQKSDGMSYAPQGKPNPVCKKGEFRIAAVALDHGHIYGQCNALTEAGAEIKWVYDPDPAKVETFLKTYHGVKVAQSLEEILDDPEIHLVTAAAVPSERGPLGIRIMQAGKDYFTDKTPFISLEQLEAARKVAAETGKKYMVYYSERLHVEGAVYAGQLIEQGVIGRVIQVLGMGPHRLSASTRPAWFFEKAKYGGILTDIGSHQIEQFLYYTGSKDAKVQSARVANFGHPEYPEFEDFGEASLIGDTGASNYFRIDWFTPNGLRTWGDGRAFILGTKGYIEIRKYVNVAADNDSDHVYIVTDEGEKHINVHGKVGYPFFGNLILDSLNRTEKAMTQEHAFKAAELCIRAQLVAEGKRREV